MRSNGEKLPLLFAEYEKMGLYHPDTIDELNSQCCGSYNDDNLLPDEFKTILTKEMERLL